LLKHPHSGIAKTGIDITRRGPGKTLCGLFGGVKYETGGQKQRFAMLQLVGTLMPCANRQGFDIEIQRRRYRYFTITGLSFAHGLFRAPSFKAVDGIIERCTGVPSTAVLELPLSPYISAWHFNHPGAHVLQARWPLVIESYI